MKKIYRINDKIEINELEEVAHGIVLKALRVIETSGNKFASRIIEHKDDEMLEDLQQSVILELIKNNYIINIEYANEHEHISKDMFCKFVSDMIDEVEFGEVAMFMDDKCLTENGKAEKNKFLAHREEI